MMRVPVLTLAAWLGMFVSAVAAEDAPRLGEGADALPPVVEEHGEPLWTFVQFSDPHISGRKPSEGKNVHLAQAVEQVNALKPDFVLVSGDLTANGQTYQFEMLKQLMAACEAPVHYLPGNHDLDKHAIQVYAKHVGQPFYSFEHKGGRFICLQTPIYEEHGGGLNREQWAWLVEELKRSAAAQHVFVVGHHDLASLRTPKDQGRRLATLLKKHRVTAYLYGHRHLQRPPTHYGLAAVCTPSVAAWNWQPDHTGRYPLGYRVFYVYADRVVSEYRTLAGRADDRYRYVLQNPRRAAAPASQPAASAPAGR